MFTLRREVLMEILNEVALLGGEAAPNRLKRGKLGLAERPKMSMKSIFPITRMMSGTLASRSVPLPTDASR